jgi:hypothetical protein
MKSLTSLPRLICTPAVLALYASAAAAQTPGLPVLQNAFANPGIAVAANFGSGSGQSFFGAAGSWGVGGGKLGLSAAAGVQRGGGSTRGAYGARASSTLWSSSGGALAVGAFAGVGGAPRTRLNNVVNNPAVMIIPVGASVGYRRAIGSRGISAYASPMFRWVRATSDSAVTTSGFRAGLGIDVGLSSSLGASIGTEIGAGGGGGSMIGAAITFAPGR